LELTPDQLMRIVEPVTIGMNLDKEQEYWASFHRIDKIHKSLSDKNKRVLRINTSIVY
jgi:hypothetical protein